MLALPLGDALHRPTERSGLDPDLVLERHERAEQGRREDAAEVRDHRLHAHLPAQAGRTISYVPRPATPPRRKPMATMPPSSWEGGSASRPAAMRSGAESASGQRSMPTRR